MRLKIDNFAKVKHADIVIDGITVIAGENNTGKSTVGKVLYSTFNSLYQIDSKIEERRREELRIICGEYVGNVVAYSIDSNKDAIAFPHFLGGRRQSIVGKVSNEMSDFLIEIDRARFNKALYREVVQKVCEKYKIQLSENDIGELIENSYERIASRKMNDDHKVAKELIERFFNLLFDEQIQCLKEPEENAKVCLTIKDKDLEIWFQENQCMDWKAEYYILHEAFLIDDPFVLDNLTDPFPSYFIQSLHGQLSGRLTETKDDIMTGIFDAVRAKESLKEIYDVLERVTKGQILNQNGQWGLKSEQFNEPVHFENLSAGLKSFVLLKMLLEKGILKEKDILILDEPEIHLHPEWQLVYAELIVLLQKKFDLSIVVTTHSRDFLEAVELYSKKYGLFSKCRFYLSGIDQGLAVFEDVTDSLDKIYRRLVTPSMLLDKIRYEMSSEEDDEF
ncbi:MAG: ATP-binding protein [Lachnospiraceae bacterium]|jgi:predicted ATP-dependent endonuclease of OLD family|nr:ATP-binding protein [Lachnospiraceae bacterium]MCI9250840.1 ATP-binding protein [Lachnospiraceae bacterium]MCI9382985.1 ATP-binding protein [Lachnospiraceae bacterium]MCI9477558.1 ATP-binding protein [Lachnospiraceae bacterium]MCI9622579.1 ATP-binding protein [Lachnospiraceae bacterium]